MCTVYIITTFVIFKNVRCTSKFPASFISHFLHYSRQITVHIYTTIDINIASAAATRTTAKEEDLTYNHIKEQPNQFNNTQQGVTIQII